MLKRTPVSYKFPSGLKERLDQAAKESGRSATAELVYRLEQSLSADHATDSDTHDKLDEIIVRLKALNAQ